MGLGSEAQLDQNGKTGKIAHHTSLSLAVMAIHDPEKSYVSPGVKFGHSTSERVISPQQGIFFFSFSFFFQGLQYHF